MKERRTLTLSDFLGVDFSSSPLHASARRSPDAVNLLRQNGLNRKRHGWRELLHLAGDAGGERRINGVFSYKEGDAEVLLIHAGTGFFRAVRDGDGFSAAPIPLPQGTVVQDTRSEAFLCRGRLYLVGCGEYLVYGTWNGGECYELRRVYEDADTYVPTTTVLISAQTPEGAPLEEANMLTAFRRNTMVGEQVELEGSFTRRLDAPVKEGTNVRVTVERQSGDGDLETLLLQTVSGVGEEASTALYLNGDSTGTSVGHIAARQELCLHFSAEPRDEGTANITVEFCADVEDCSLPLRESCCGTVFGANGFSDRLFLGGSSVEPGTEYYSALDDFTYFSTARCCQVGTDAGAVTGYLRMNDGTLAVFRDASPSAPSVWFRSGSYVKETDSEGALTAFSVEFQDQAGPTGVAQISRAALTDYAGEKLLLTGKGVYALTLVGNVSSTERLLRCRSWSVTERLSAEPGLADAVATVHDGRYWLAVGSHCYVADQSLTLEDPSGGIGYEWWYLEGVPARVFFTDGGVLCFGTADGRLCAFDGEYVDRTYFQTERGDLAVEEGRLVYRRDLESVPDAGDRVILDGEVLGLLFDAEEMSVSEDRVTVSPEGIARVVEGDTVLADLSEDSGLTEGTEYTVSAVDRSSCSFALKRGGSTLPIAAGGFRLHRRLSGQELTVAERDEVSCSLLLSLFGDGILISDYGGTYPDEPVARLCHRAPVRARWVTPPLSLGDPGEQKTLLSLTVVSDPAATGNVEIGYETANELFSFRSRGLDSFSFEKMDFHHFSFRPRFASSFTKKVMTRNFTFIRFFFESETEEDCAVCTLSASYKFNQKNRGVR